jgi:hypothetical protein
MSPKSQDKIHLAELNRTLLFDFNIGGFWRFEKNRCQKFINIELELKRSVLKAISVVLEADT